MDRIVDLERYGEGEKYQLHNIVTGKDMAHTLTHRGGWKWTTISSDGFKTHWRTDKDGCGLWRDGEQLCGTCQYTAKKTEEEQRQKIVEENRY